MRRTRIKFCGITRVEDAVAAADAGANAIGLVFHPPSPRAVTMDQAAEIMDQLPPFLATVGLFVDTAAVDIAAALGQLGITHVQLHGSESPEVASSLGYFRVIKAIRVQRGRFAEKLGLWRAATLQMQLGHLSLLLETAAPTPDGVPGGSGVENDWDAIAAAREAGAFVGLPPIILAGGLTPENVGAVVRRLRPYAVDVSSGIESSKGIKSVEKMVAFARAVAEADADS